MYCLFTIYQLISVPEWTCFCIISRLSLTQKGLNTQQPQSPFILPASLFFPHSLFLKCHPTSSVPPSSQSPRIIWLQACCPDNCEFWATGMTSQLPPCWTPCSLHWTVQHPTSAWLLDDSDNYKDLVCGFRLCEPVITPEILHQKITQLTVRVRGPPISWLTGGGTRDWRISHQGPGPSGLVCAQRCVLSTTTPLPRHTWHNSKPPGVVKTIWSWICWRFWRWQWTPGEYSYSWTNPLLHCNGHRLTYMFLIFF